MADEDDATTNPINLLEGARRFVARIDSNRFLFIVVFLPLAGLYLTTASWGIPYHIDPLSNAVTAWYLADTASPILREHAHLTGDNYRGNVGWYVETPRGVVSQYPPGAALAAVPLYLVSSADLEPARIYGVNNPGAGAVDYPLPPLWPATATASLATAAAMGILAVSFVTIATPLQSMLGALALGLGTSAWSVASDALWQHGPAMFWIALAMYFASRYRFLPSGTAMGFAIITRPPLAIIAAAIGLAVTLAQRSVLPALKVGIPAALGLVSIILYNTWLFGTPSISGAYGSVFVDRAIDSGVRWYLVNIAGGLFDLRSGLLVWSPFLLLAIPGIRRTWGSLPPAWKGSAIGGGLYLLVQWKANRFSGGDGFFAYRYPLEMLVATSPLLLSSTVRWATSPRRRRYLIASLAAAVLAQAAGAIL